MCDAMAAEQTPNEVLYEAIPHLRELADCPCGCNDRTEIWACVIHLNDRAKWTRERIADWLETLDQDLQFKLPESPENTEGNVE